MNFWQENTLEELVTILKPNEDVVALLLFGSCCRSERNFDYWSDVDVLLVVKESALENYYPETDWLSQLGNIYTYSQSLDEFKCTTRVCYDDFRRIDVIVTSEENLRAIGNWSRNPLSRKAKKLFSRSIIVDDFLKSVPVKPSITPISETRFQTMVNDFRFKSALAVYKIVRNDLLIALHLALDLIRDCCQLGMMLRDRIEGTDFHTQGGIGNQMVDQLQGTFKPFTPEGILAIVEQSNLEFEKLACQWSDIHHDNSQPLRAWIEKAKEKLSS
jgi:predicted nucleotidyltransferase